MVHPGRLTRNIIMEVWKIIFLSKWVICRFHVNLPGCKFGSPKAAIPLHLIQPTDRVTDSPPHTSSLYQLGSGCCSTLFHGRNLKGKRSEMLIRERSFLTLATSCYIQIVGLESLFAASAKLCSLMVITGCVHGL